MFGVIWDISAEDEKALDRYEGVSVGCYNKETLKVRPEGYFTKFPMLVYISRRGKNNGERRDGYMEKIVEAVEKLSFDSSYIGMLKYIKNIRANEDIRLTAEQLHRAMKSTEELFERCTRRLCVNTPGFESMSPEEKEKLHDEIYKMVSHTTCVDYTGCI